MTAIGAVDNGSLGHQGQSPQHSPLQPARRQKPHPQCWSNGHANGRDIEETADEVAKYKQMGYLAVRAQTGIPACPPLRVAKEKMFYEPAEKGLPPENTWSSEKYLLHVPRLFEALRLKFGDELHLLHDVHHRLTPSKLPAWERAWSPITSSGSKTPSRRTAGRLPPDPPAHHHAARGWRSLQHHLGRQPLITEQLIDYLRMTVVHGGGFTHLKKIAALAETYHVRTGCHGATDLSPVAMAAALHFDISVNNFGIQEYMRHTAQTDEVFPHSYFFKDGHLHPGEAPALGVDYNEKLAATFPYERAYLPVNRKLDGTMWNW